MAVSVVLSALLLLASTASAYKIIGDILTYSARKNPDGSYEVYIRFKENYDICGLPDFWACNDGDCGNKTFLDGHVDYSNKGFRWCQQDRLIKTTISKNIPFTLKKERCCWIDNIVDRKASINFLTTIDLGERSDTSKPNSSPVVTTLPVLRVPQNCARKYNLSYFDPDHDQVRCRYGLPDTSTCGICNQHAGFTLVKSTCSLSYDSSSEGVYIFELVMEDYPRKEITLNYVNGDLSIKSPFDGASNVLPLSRIPLQFALKVEEPAPSCTEGEYLPRFIHPTPRHGKYLQARVNQELEIRVKATATFSSITGVIFSGPMNSKKETTTTGDYLINWTPTSDDYGQPFPFCFIAEGQFGSSSYQSEMRCVIVEVKAEGPKAQVNCNKDTMSVSIERDTILGIHGDLLRVNNDDSCAVSSNSTHVFTTFSLNGCGTKIEETDEHLLFRNIIVFLDNPKNKITRKDEIEIELTCKYQKKSSIATKFDAHRPAVNFTERGFGSFSYEFEFYQSDSFKDMQNPNSYPLEYNVGEKIYMEIAPVNVMQNTEIFLESCVAAPCDNPNCPISYPIITDGCGVDETVKIYTSHEPDVKFSMEAFRFIGQYDQVFISCSIIICQADNPKTRCAQGCTNKIKVPLHGIKTREAAIQTGSHFISQGPLRLRRSASLNEAITPSLNLNLIFVAGCVIAVVAMVCGMMVYKSRGSKVNYQLLKSDEK